MIKTNKSWQRHFPKRPSRIKRDFYNSKQISRSKVLSIVILIIAIIFLIQSVFQIKYFRIENINLVGQSDLNSEEVEQFINTSLDTSKFLFFKNNNYFLVPVDQLASQLKEQYNLEDVQIVKKWPDQLKIAVKERASHFIWQKDDTLYLLDAQGLLNRQISFLDDKYLVLEDKRDNRPQGEEIFSVSEIDIINKIYVNWIDLIGASAKLSKITIYNDWSLELHTATGFYVKIDKDQDIREQLNNLHLVLEENVAGVDIDYIDIRFGDKVYFK